MYNQIDLIAEELQQLTEKCSQDAETACDNLEKNSDFYGYMIDVLSDNKYFWDALGLDEEMSDIVCDKALFWTTCIKGQISVVGELVQECSRRFCAGNMGLEYDDMF